MLDGICPKCHSNDVAGPLRLLTSHQTTPHVQMREPDPPDRPFIWLPETVRSEFFAFVCAGCGYTEFYAGNYRELGAARRRGFQSS
ncbi:MAG: hypothetical protein JSS81_03140 [Acidobacteria bacterium]|nr:hypothetical protein [Acidobacteriota bacterium]